MTDPFTIFISYMRTWKSKKVHYLSQLPPTALLPTTAAGGAEFAYLTWTLYFLFQTWALPPVPFDTKSTKKKTMQIMHENGKWYKASFSHGADSVHVYI